MSAALSLSERGVGLTGNNPPVGCLIIRDGSIVGRGWTQRGGRPHAEAMALEQAGEAARGADIYVTLEPCAHISERGPACTALLASISPRRVVIAANDADPRTAGRGIEMLRSAGIEVVSGVMAVEACAVMAGFFSRIERGRPHVTLKLATSLDGMIAMADGSSRWITGNAARAHAHLERARADAILVGAGTIRADNPSLDVRLDGLAGRSPRRIMLGRGEAPGGWEAIWTPEDITKLDCGSVLVEGGAATASAFLRAGLVDRLLLYRAPILIGNGKAALSDIGLATLGDAHGQWRLADTRRLGNDRMEVYEAVEQIVREDPCLQA